MWITVYEVEYNEQRVFSGEAGSPDCDWDWVTTYEEFSDLATAEKRFAKATPTSSVPNISLYEVTKHAVYGYTEERILLDEKWA